MIRIKNAGMLSTVQDLGRVGVMTNGFTHGGVMDTYSTRIANLLCSNDVNAPVIEMTMLGITAEFCDDCVFVKIMKETAELLGEDCEQGYPYDGAKLHYVLDIDNSDLARQTVMAVYNCRKDKSKKSK